MYDTFFYKNRERVNKILCACSKTGVPEPRVACSLERVPVGDRAEAVLQRGRDEDSESEHATRRQGGVLEQVPLKRLIKNVHEKPFHIIIPHFKNARVGGVILTREWKKKSLFFRNSGGMLI